MCAWSSTVLPRVQLLPAEKLFLKTYCPWAIATTDEIHFMYIQLSESQGSRWHLAFSLPLSLTKRKSYFQEMIVIHLVLSCAKGNLNHWCISETHLTVRERNPALKIHHHMAANLPYLSLFTVLVKWVWHAAEYHSGCWNLGIHWLTTCMSDVESS